MFVINLVDDRILGTMVPEIKHPGRVIHARGGNMQMGEIFVTVLFVDLLMLQRLCYLRFQLLTPAMLYSVVKQAVLGLLGHWLID